LSVALDQEAALAEHPVLRRPRGERILLPLEPLEPIDISALNDKLFSGRRGAALSALPAAEELIEVLKQRLRARVSFACWALLRGRHWFPTEAVGAVRERDRCCRLFSHRGLRVDGRDHQRVSQEPALLRLKSWPPVLIEVECPVL